MFNVAIVLNNTNANISLSFKTREAADNLFKKYEAALVGEMFNFEDDFGHRAMVPLHHIAYPLFIDVEQDQICRFEQDLTARRTERKLIMRLNENAEERSLFPTQAPAQNGQRPSIIQ